MNNYVKTLLILFICSSCKTSEKKPEIEELVLFGYSGYCLIDSLYQSSPCDDYYLYDSLKFRLDTTQLDIRRYFDYKKDSLPRIAKRMWKEQIRYLRGTVSDALKIKNLANKILVHTFKKEYFNDQDRPIIYDDYVYTLYYKTTDQKTFMIRYESNMLTDSLKVLHDVINKMILSAKPNSSGKFEFNSVTRIEAADIYKNRKYDLPPPPSKLEKKIKFHFKKPETK